jgi:dolichol-phosphate mannosyltransferase
VKGFLDLMTVKFLTSFSHRPQHVLGSLGLASFALGFLGLSYLALTWVVRAIDPESGYLPLHERAMLTYSMGAMLLGAQLLSIGFLAELMVANRDLHEVAYSIAEQTPSAAPDASHVVPGPR